MNVFDFAFNYLMGDEGRTYTNDPRDSGGPTKFGITLNTYAAFLKRVVSPEEIENLSEEDARYFYFWEYWIKLQCDEIKTPGIAICIFDCAVLYGDNPAVIIAQKAISLLTGATLKFDGVVGDMTLKLLSSVKEELFLKTYQVLVLKRIDNVIAAHPKDEAFRRGWTRRADRLLTLNGVEHLINGTETT